MYDKGRQLLKMKNLYRQHMLLYIKNAGKQPKCTDERMNMFILFKYVGRLANNFAFGKIEHTIFNQVIQIYMQSRPTREMQSS